MAVSPPPTGRSETRQRRINSDSPRRASASAVAGRADAWGATCPEPGRSIRNRQSLSLKPSVIGRAAVKMQRWYDGSSRHGLVRTRLNSYVIAESSMIIFRSSHRVLFRYDSPNTASAILGGNIRVTTLDACRNAENASARDAGEGTKTTTSLPGTTSLNARDFARMLGVDPRGIEIRGRNAVVTHGTNAVHRTERLENAFVFCTSALENDLSMKGRFGDGCLRITNAVAFFELIDEALRRKVAPNELAQCVVDDVVYAPRTNNYRDHTNKHCAFIKPYGEQSSFEKESEVRSVWIPQGFNVVPVFLDIPEIHELLELL